MKIRYEVTVDDWVALGCYHFGQSTGRRQQRAGGLVWETLAAVGLFLGATSVVGAEAAVGVFAFVAALILFIRGALGLHGLRSHRRVRELYEAVLPRGEIGPHELELTEDCLVERTLSSERRTPLEDVEEVTSDGGHTFLYLGPALACVIPHRAVSDGVRETFLEAVTTRMSGLSAEPDAAAGWPRG